jgi:hypothetical protein
MSTEFTLAIRDFITITSQRLRSKVDSAVEIKIRDRISQIQFPHYFEEYDLRSGLESLNRLLGGDAKTGSFCSTPPSFQMIFTSVDKHGHFTCEVTTDIEFGVLGEGQSIHRYCFGIDQTDVRLLRDQIEKALIGM